MNIAFCASEVDPFAKTGGLADVAGHLPIALSLLGHRVKVFLPYYKEIKQKDFDIKLAQHGLGVKLGAIYYSFSLYSYETSGVIFYFIERNDFFVRDYIYGTPSGDYGDNAKRFAFFSKAVLRSIEALNFECDVIHCNDWQTALIPFYLRFDPVNKPYFENTVSLFTIHNLAYQGVFPKETLPELGIDYKFFTHESLEFYDKVCFIKAGLIYSNMLSTVSKAYAKEILTGEYGWGLDSLLNHKKDKIYAIMNGVDYSVWSPQKDKFIKENFDKNSLDKKIVCKQDLLDYVGLKMPLDKPLLGIVSRLVEQKGIDIIANSVGELVRLGCNLVVLGLGEGRFINTLKSLEQKYPDRLSINIKYDNVLSHKIEAGSDMYLMPSRYEPCGLNQMYSLKYGTIPIVRATGGLDDTIIDYAKDSINGNGFKFQNANPSDFMTAIKNALTIYKNKKEWENLLKRVMELDFSWEHSAKEYIKLYDLIINKENQ